MGGAGQEQGQGHEGAWLLVVTTVKRGIGMELGVHMRMAVQVCCLVSFPHALTFCASAHLQRAASFLLPAHLLHGNVLEC